MFTDLRLLLLLAARPESLLCKKAELVVTAAAEVVAVGITEIGALVMVTVARVAPTHRPQYPQELQEQSNY